MIHIKLNNSAWFFDPTSPLGPEGGFGEVFEGLDSSDNEVAVKRLKVGPDRLAHREMDIAEELSNTEFSNVIRIFDYGLDAQSNNYFLVMERAEYSLHDYLQSQNALEEHAALKILADICNGLNETQKFVHRDLKPGNVLLSKGIWKLSDYGIARFIEKSTSLRTLKDFLSPEYAAPEQWKLEHATNATDIYALGCICHFLMTGAPPFDKSQVADLKEAHLQAPPPPLPNASNRLRSLTGTMLRKHPESRPTLDRIRTVIHDITTSPPNTAGRNVWKSLQKAEAEVVDEENTRAAQQEKVRIEWEKRKQIHADSILQLEEIKKDFFNQLSTNAPAVNIVGSSSARLGKGVISIEHSVRTMFEANSFNDTNWDFISSGIISLKQSTPLYKWSASLLYGSPKDVAQYRWYEVSFFTSAYVQKRTPYEPFSLSKSDEINIALSNIMSGTSVAFGPEAIDDESFDSFLERWVELLAQASRGMLQHPSSLPL